ncbi:unnamed protein product [Rotaria sordida]|uniref:Uncharacterized protein n=1 Tax=Rotaria sordida TaxID=392033 RepID=A0A819ECZ6_9BILA|nr:unnamed protein product [Rotaria sordida]
MDIIADLQTKLIKNATEDEIQYGLRIFRSVHQLYSHDNEFHNLSLYVRHNREKQGNLRIDDSAIDIQLLNMNNEFVSLLSYFHSNRPLLIIADSVDIITVYIEEAHAVDECDDDRIRIANDFIKATEYRILLLIDPVSKNNPFSQVYSPWPIRFYVIDPMKKFSYIAQPIQGSFSLELIRNALDEVVQQCQ